MKEQLVKYLMKKIVLDTNSSWTYIGTLEEVTDHCAILSEVDVHDNKDTPSSKEMYIWQSSTSGIKANRNRAFINLDFAVSFSLLEDIKKF